MSVGTKLRYARERSGFTLEQVQERTGIGSSSLSEFENDKRELRLSQIQKLAELYRRSVSFLLSDEPVHSEIVLWRERPDEAVVQQIERLFLQFSERYHNLEIWCGEHSDVRLPEAVPSGRQFDYAQAEALANRFRKALQLGDQPGTELLRVLEEVCSTKVLHRDFDPSGTAASTKHAEYGFAILLNGRNVRWRRNFDLAHELFHLLTWEVFRSPDEDTSARASGYEEKLANCFAGNLLIPTEALRDAICNRLHDGRLPIAAVPDIARLFDVSVDAVLWRIHVLYNRSKEQRDITRREIDIAKSADEQRQDTPAPELPERYRSLALKALWRGSISVGRFAEYMGISRQAAMRYVNQGADLSEEIPITTA